MKKLFIPLFKLAVPVCLVAALVTSASCSGSHTAQQAEIDSLKTQIHNLLAGQQLTNEYLNRFDTLDFVVFSNQEWVRFHETHDENIRVYWPDGHMTEGLPRHIEDMKAMFVYAPNTQIKQHPIRFGSGPYTAVTGIMEGTFTEPMPIGNGKFIRPTGKSFRVPMATIGVWEDNVMVEEHLFWDNQTYMQQLGVTQ